MPIGSHLPRSLSAMDVPQQPVVAMFNLATAFRRDRSPSRAHIRQNPAESARQAFSCSDHGSSLRPPAIGGHYFSRSFELPTSTDDRPKLRRSPRASFDENAPVLSSHLQVADIIPHTCGRRRSSTMSHRSPTHVHESIFEFCTVNERPHSQQRFSPSPSPRRSPVPPSTNSIGNEAPWSSGQRDARYDRGSSIQKPLDDSFDEATSSGGRDKLERRRSSNVDWESSRERSPPLPSARSDERSSALSADIRRRLSIGIGTRTWKSDESTRPRIKKTSAVDSARPSLVKQPSNVRQAPQTPPPQQQRQQQKPRQATTRPLTRAMTLESGAGASSSSSSDKKPRAFVSSPGLFDPLVGRTLTLKSLLPKEKKALRLTFSVMNNNMFVKLMEQILHRLETACPEIRSLFFTTAFINSFSKTPEQQENHCQLKTVHDHAKIMAQMFEDIISNLDTYDVMVPYLRQYGQKHALMCSSGFKVEVIEKFGELAVDYIGKQEAIKYNHIAVGAWRLLIACITDEMRFGFERECKKNGRQNSIGDPADIDTFRATK